MKWEISKDKKDQYVLTRNGIVILVSYDIKEITRKIEDIEEFGDKTTLGNLFARLFTI